MSKHRARRTAARTVPATAGPGRHADTTEPGALANRAPLGALVAVLVVLLVAVGVGTAGVLAAVGTVNVRPPAPIPAPMLTAPVADWSMDTATDGPPDGWDTVDPAAVAALVADGAGSTEDVTAAVLAACTDPTTADRLTADGWTPGQVARLADAAPCPTGPALGEQLGTDAGLVTVPNP